VKEFEVSRRAPGRTLPWILFWWGVWPFVVSVPLFLLYRVRRHNFDRIPRTGPVLYLCNHQSFLDLMLVGIMIRDRPFTPMGRSTLWNTSFMRWVMNGFRSIAVERSGSNLAAIKAGVRELEAGRCILIFPEGGRSRDGALRPFERGVMLLIKRADAMVVPMALEGAYDSWPPGRALPRLTGVVQAIAGHPISTRQLAAMDDGHALEFLRRTVEELRLDLRARIRKASGGTWPPPGPADQPYWEREQLK
jgi:1-acyl-sn-glycerol-3-phosphate acyltransferase